MQQTSVHKTREQACLVCGYVLATEAIRCDQCGTPVVDRATRDLEPEARTEQQAAAEAPAGKRDWLLTAGVTVAIGLATVGLAQQMLSGPPMPAPSATYLVVNGGAGQLAWVMPDQAGRALAAQAVVATPRQMGLLYAMTQGTYERAIDVQGTRMPIGVATLDTVPEKALLVRSYLAPRKGQAMLVAYVSLPADKAEDKAFQSQVADLAVGELNKLPVR